METFSVNVTADHRWVFVPLSARARKWVSNNMFAGAINVDRSRATCVVRALLAEGFALVPGSADAPVVEE